VTLVPERLKRACHDGHDRRAWLDRLPVLLRDLQRRWLLTLHAPFESGDGSCSWVATVTCADGTPAVLKVPFPHMEGEHEIDGLRFWDGNPTVRLLDAHEDSGAMLLERCEPGTPLAADPEPHQDVVIAHLLRRMWRVPPAPHCFRPLSAMLACWRDETLSDAASWPDEALVRRGLDVFERLSAPRDDDVLLATDLHPGNVLRAQREPWLAIDPKPFVGDPAYDATQHLLNCRARLQCDAHGTIQRFADLLNVDAGRVRLWLFARAAAAPRDDWRDAFLIDLARRIDR
jgi:streptomycin 6-kinase